MPARRGRKTPVTQERIQQLKEFHLTDYQARVYLALLDLGTAVANQISAPSRVPRTRIYATMQQLHAKGLVQILPEKPLRYKAVPFANYLKALAEDYRARARRLTANLENLAGDFRVSAVEMPEQRGRFEALYGRRNVRDKLLEMYEHAENEIIAIGSTHSPARILQGLGTNLEQKAAAGVRVKLAFCVQPDNEADIRVLSRYAEVRHIDFFTPVARHGVDGRQFLMSHPIPDDDHPFRGEDIAIWTDDPAIALAMAQMAHRIWEIGKPVTQVAKALPRGPKGAELTPSAGSSGG